MSGWRSSLLEPSPNATAREPVPLVEAARACVDLEAVQLEPAGRRSLARSTSRRPSPCPIQPGAMYSWSTSSSDRAINPTTRPVVVDRDPRLVDRDASRSASQRRTSSSGWAGGKSNVARQDASQTSPSAGRVVGRPPDRTLGVRGGARADATRPRQRGSRAAAASSRIQVASSRGERAGQRARVASGPRRSRGLGALAAPMATTRTSGRPR